MGSASSRWQCPFELLALAVLMTLVRPSSLSPCSGRYWTFFRLPIPCSPVLTCPALTATTVQRGWSWYAEANLLAAGIGTNWFNSGIYTSFFLFSCLPFLPKQQSVWCVFLGYYCCWWPCKIEKTDNSRPFANPSLKALESTAVGMSCAPSTIPQLSRNLTC